MIWGSRRTTFEDLSTEAALDALIQASMSEPIVLFKHSQMCGASYRAQREMEEYGREASPRVNRLVVQRARALSERIEDLFGIRHQTPQVIVLFGGVSVFDTSHRGVTAEAVRAAISSVQRHND
ncbi:MAG: bacillithiol system redox-active protein YtxJ [Rhodothermales bacterium]|nr:bacillithiol system redox-active protein YtxJ [Rhodothermales bacterium]